MSVAFWCLLAALIAPYVLSMAARSNARYGEYVPDPRAYSESLTGWRRRAHLAHQNGFEAVPAIVAGVMVAEIAGAPRAYIDGLALAFIGFRGIHAFAYIVDRPVLRSMAWGMGMLSVIGLFVAAALRGGA